MINYKSRNFVLASIILIGSIFFIHFISINYKSFHFGKDHGLIFRIILFCAVSAIFFSIVKSEIGYLIVGFLIGLIAYILSFLLVIGLSLLIKENTTGWDISLVWNQLIATMIVFCIGLWMQAKK